jgi:outer membrane protein
MNICAKNSKVVLSLSLLLICLNASGQFTKGTFLLGGSVGGSYSTSTSAVFLLPSGFSAGNPPPTQQITFTADKSNFTVIASPQVGYFIVDNVSVGLRLSWASLSTQEKYLSYKSTNDQSVFSVEPFVRFYLSKFFAQGTFGIGSTNSESSLEYAITSGSSTSSSSQNLKRNASTLIGSISIGRAFLVSKQLALEPLLGYQFTKVSYKEIPEEKIGTFYLALGLQYYLSK